MTFGTAPFNMLVIRVFWLLFFEMRVKFLV
jgi:hypothetical protein